jgi:hypothetical protein
MSSPETTPLALTDELKSLVDKAFDEKAAIVVAAVGADQKPVVSFRGSLKPYSDDQLAFWARHAQGGTIDAIRANPNVAVLLRSASVPMLQFHGRARVAESEAERSRVYEAAPQPEQAADAERKGTAVIIDLDRIEGVLRMGPDGPVFCRMSRAGA